MHKHDSQHAQTTEFTHLPVMDTLRMLLLPALLLVHMLCWHCCTHAHRKC
jgi:hypothetical protein